MRRRAAWLRALYAEAEAARRRKEQLQAENAKNAERLGSYMSYRCF